MGYFIPVGLSAYLTQTGRIQGHQFQLENQSGLSRVEVEG